MIRFAVLTLYLWIGAAHAQAQTCRQALILGLDVSLSVNQNDFRLQRDGLAGALLDTDVTRAFLDPGGYVELAVFEWSGQYDQTMIVDWTPIDSIETMQSIASALIDTPQSARTGRTGVGGAMLFARNKLMERRHCTVHTLDLSGDGQNNNGPEPQVLRDHLEQQGIVINGLVIEPGAPDIGNGLLSTYYHDKVIAGPNAFVETIFGFDNYQQAMTSKLLQELAPALSLRAGPRRYALYRLDRGN